jgi:hypothetical protein
MHNDHSEHQHENSEQREDHQQAVQRNARKPDDGAAAVLDA